MSRPLVLDTTLVIQLLRNEAVWPGYTRALATGRAWLTAVTVTEVLAGTRSAEDSRLFERLVDVVQRVDRLATPTIAEWRLAGRLLARHTRLHGHVQPRDHLADILILLCAARVGGAVVTSNVRHFERWAHLAMAAGLNVSVVAPLH